MDLNDPQVQAIIAAAASAAVAQYVRDNPPQPGPAGPTGDRGPPGNDGAGSGNGSPAQLKADDIGFFDPSYEDPTNSPVVNVGRHVFYRDVYAFIDRLKDLVSLKGEDKTREVLPTCLRGSALIWHSTELTELEKRGLRNASVDEWCETLVEKFKERTSVALQHLQTEHYTINDARQGRTPRSFAQNMLRHAKAAHMTSVYNQLSLAWNNLALEFRRDIPEPTMATTLSQFLAQLDSKENIWYEMARQQSRGQQQQVDRRSSTLPKQSGQYSNNRQGGFSKPPFPFPSYGQQPQGFPQTYGNYYGNSFANQPPRQYQPYQQAPQGSRQSTPIPALPAPRQPLQITGGSGLPSQSSNQANPRYGGNGRQGSRPNAGFSNRYQNRPSRPQGTAYQASETDSALQTPSDLDSESSPEDASVSQAEEPGNYYADEELDYYQPRQEDESEGYFAGAPAVSFHCRHCHAVFSSGNELHKHLGNAGKGRRATKSSCQGRPSPKESASTAQEPASTAQEPASTAKEPASVAAFPAVPENPQEIIKSSADSSQEIGSGHAFRGYHYAMGPAKVTEDAVPEELCFDTGCGITLADRDWFHQVLPGKEVHQMASPISVRGLGSNKHRTSEYAVFPLFLPGRKNGKSVIAMTAPREVHLVDNLKAKMLIGMDFMVPEKIDILASKSAAWIGSCGVEIPLEMRTRGRPVLHPIHAKKSTIIPPHSQASVPVHHASLPDRDFFFEPDQGPLSLYAHLADASMNFVIAKNSSDQAVKIPRNLRLGTLQEADFDNCFHVTEGRSDVAELATRRPKKEHQKSWIKRVFNKVVTASAIALLATATPISSVKPGVTPEAMSGSTSPKVAGDPSFSSPFSETTTLAPEIAVIPTEADIVLPNGATVYEGNPAIRSVVEEFPELWREGGFADVPQEEWMRIPLKSDWEQHVPRTARVYPLGKDAKEVVDKTFDKLHDQGRLSWTTESTPFSYPVFVVWKMMPDGTRKGRAVVDIRGLNSITQADVYPLPLQADLISSVKGCRYISIVDCASFFYQWRMHPQDRHRLTIISHRGQETFNVAVMGYKNSPAYVQRQIDRLLRKFRSFARAYVDDVVIYSKTLEEHLEHLRQIFGLFVRAGISVNPSKAFLGYPSVQLLGQKVDSLGLWTSEDKLQAISRLSFPDTLAKLETYLGMTGWLRDYIAHYAAIAKPLQDRKTIMLANSPKAGHERKNFATRTELRMPTKLELESFGALQNALSRPSFLVHFDDKQTLYIDLDASKDFGFGAMVYHVAGTIKAGEAYPRRSQIRPILFLSRLLKDAETRYWPTELELAGIVWVLSKTRHMVESAPHTVVYTDHGAALGIAKQTTLTTSSTAKLNLRVIRASEYIQRFRSLEFRHKPGKQHVVPDALSRLSQEPHARPEGEGQLDIYHVTLVEMSDDFKTRITAEYVKDSQWNKVLEVLKKARQEAQEDARLERPAGTRNHTPESDSGNENPATVTEARPDPEARQDLGNKPLDPEDESTQKIGLRFKLREGLIYYTNFDDGRERLCVPNALEKEIFELSHDRQHHGGFHRSYDRIASSVYMRHLSKHLRAYIEHCPECELNQTKRHKPYGSMVPIDRPGIPFHTIAMDFIVALPLTLAGLDCLLTVTDKFSKRVLLIPGKSTYSAVEWADVLLANLTQHGWGVPVATISDRDAKFMSEVWQRIFQKLGTEVLASTAYHPQTDGQSERTNQTVEIAMRYFVTANPTLDWTDVLPYLQGCLNNSKNQSTGVSPNEVLYGFNVRDSLGLLSELPPEDFSRLRQLKRDQAEESLAFANVMAKAYFDKSHKPLKLAKGSKAYLRLHHGYEIPGIGNRKLHHQRVGPFKILEKIGKLAYRLELPPVMTIHPVVSVVQLEPGSKDEDPYGRPRNINPPHVVETEDEIEILLEKRISRGKVQYLVKWKDYGNEHNVWYDIDDLRNAQELVDECDAREQARPARISRRRARATEARPNPTPQGRPRRASRTQVRSAPEHRSSPDLPARTRIPPTEQALVRVQIPLEGGSLLR